MNLTEKGSMAQGREAPASRPALGSGQPLQVVLVIEDSQAMAEAAAEALQTAGYKVKSCLSVSEALSCCQEHRPAVVVTEYFVNDGTGLEFIKKMAKLDWQPPVIMCTGCGHEKVAAEALALGAWAYEVKSEAYLELLPQIVTRCLDESGAKKEALDKENLWRRLEAQNELSGWLAHNFKNILAASIGYLNLIDLKNKDQDRQKQLEYLQDSRQSQESALRLLEDLSRMTDVDTSRGETELIILGEVVDGAWEMVKWKVASALAGSGVEAAQEKVERILFFNSARRLAPVHLVASEMSSIFEALLQNAVEAVLTMPEPRIAVSGEIKNDCLELTIRDNGQGMSTNVLKHAQEPLFSTKGEVGVGLGLSLVRSLVVRQGGDLSLRSTIGGGTVVTIKYHRDFLFDQTVA